MTLAVVISPEAEAQTKEIDCWWREHRTAAPGLFVQELSSVIATLEAMPLVGHRVDHPEVRELRRILLRATRYHLYYVVVDETVLVLALWSAVRGTGPKLTP